MYDTSTQVRVASALLAFLVLGSPAGAQTTAKPHKTTPRVVAPRAARMGVYGVNRRAAMQRQGMAMRNANKAMIHTASSQIVGQLQAVTAILNQSDRDYQGHRVQALKEIGQAMRALQPGSAPANLAKTGAARNGGGDTTPKATSDKHLKEALQMLTVLQSQNSGPAVNGQYVRAGAAIQRAIQELNLALK